MKKSVLLLGLLMASFFNVNAQVMTFNSGPTETGFTLNGWGNLSAGAINQSNLNSSSTISVNNGVFNITSFSVGPYSGGNTINVSSNLGDSYTYNSGSLVTHTLNWSNITTLTFTRTSGSGPAADYDNFVYTIPSLLPTVTNFSPTSGEVGTSVTITGTDFDATASNNTVYFGAVKRQLRHLQLQV